eukprot:SAG22_NODE_1917_length_3316_cov_4.498912_5_plen_162_part_00
MSIEALDMERALRPPISAEMLLACEAGSVDLALELINDGGEDVDAAGGECCGYDAGGGGGGGGGSGGDRNAEVEHEATCADMQAELAELRARLEHETRLRQEAQQQHGQLLKRVNNLESKQPATVGGAAAQVLPPPTAAVPVAWRRCQSRAPYLGRPRTKT